MAIKFIWKGIKMSFENLIGNEKIKQILETTVKNNNVLHSYMFVGQEGIGKNLFAKEPALPEEYKECSEYQEKNGSKNNRA